MSFSVFVVCVDFVLVPKMLLKDLDLSRVSSMMFPELNSLTVLFNAPFPSQKVNHNSHEWVFHGACIVKHFILWLS